VTARAGGDMLMGSWHGHGPIAVVDRASRSWCCCAPASATTRRAP